MKGWVLIFLALAAYLSVLTVSDKLEAAGDTQAIYNKNVVVCLFDKTTFTKEGKWVIFFQGFIPKRMAFGRTWLTTFLGSMLAMLTIIQRTL